MHAAAAEPAQDPSPVAVAAEPAAVDTRSDPAWKVYHDVFAALMQGEQTRARDLAAALLRDFPAHPASELVRNAHLVLAPGAVDARRDAGEDRNKGETASRGARAELAIFQSLHGAAIGIEACIALDCREGQAYFGLALAGGAIGALAAVRLDNLTSGQRALLNSGTIWGATNAALVLVMTEPESQAGALTLLAGQGAGLFAGAALFAVHPTAGQVALANSGGEWGYVLSTLALEASRTSLNNHERAATAMIAIDAGLAAGAYFASRFPAVSRAQTLVIDAGGIVGTVGGGSLGVVISGSIDDPTTPALAAVGAVIGLGAAAYFTRDWGDDTKHSLHTYVAPPERGRGGVAGVGFVW
jgi:hypothetical protein